MAKDLKDQVVERILAGDRRGAIELVDVWAGEHSYDRAVTEILEPVLARFGEIWTTTEDLSLAQGFVAGRVAEDIMERAAESCGAVPSAEPSKGPVVIGNIEDDCHALGRRLVTTFLRSAGWQVHDLGNDVLPARFMDTIVEVGAPIVAASAMMYTTAMNIRRLRDEIDDRGLTGQVQLAVGGAVFIERPELVEMVGGDGTARNAIEAPQLMNRLLGRVVSKDGV